MQYLLSVIDDGDAKDTGDEQRAIDEFNARMQTDGYWVFAGGLTMPSDATVVDNRGAQPLITDGPFIESKEFLAGFWIVEVSDLDAALGLATEGSQACNRKVEVRPFHAG